MASQTIWLLFFIIILAIVIPVYASTGIPDNSAARVLTGNSTLHCSVGTFWYTVNPIGTPRVGDAFSLSGTTNLPVGQEINYGVQIADLGPGSPDLRPPSLTGSTYVIRGTDENNTWSLKVDTTGFKKETGVKSSAIPGEYRFFMGPFCDKMFLFTLLKNETISMNSTDIGTTPFIAIDPCKTHTTGEEFSINGTTNLAASNESLLLQIGTAEFNPGGFGSSLYTVNVSVQRGNNGENFWSAEILPSRWQMYTKPPNYYPTPTFEPARPGKYQVVVSSKNPYEPDITATQQLILVSSETGNNPDSVQPVVPSKNFTHIPEFSDTTPQPATTSSASDMVFPGIALGISVAAVAYSWKKKE